MAPAGRGVGATLAILLGAVGLAYLALTALVYVQQPHFIYFPSRAAGVTPAAIGLSYADVHLDTADGVRLHGWYLPAAGARGTLLFLHGNAGHIGHRLDSLALFNELAMAVLIIDYRGYGASGGRPHERGTYADAEAAWRYLVEDRGIDPDTIVVFGRSLGAAIAIHLATRVEAAGLVVESGFTSVRDLARHHYPWLPGALALRIRYPALERIGAVRCPVLVAHGRGDGIVPFAMGERLYAAAPAPKWFLELDGGHNDGFLRTGNRYRAALARFFAQVLPAANPID